MDLVRIHALNVAFAESMLNVESKIDKQHVFVLLDTKEIHALNVRNLKF